MSQAQRELAIWLLSLLVLSAVACTLDNPGSLDACYHLHVAQNLAQGRGMVEDIVWNYLDKSEAALALPHASHLYWMPLTSWLAYLGIVTFSPWLSSFAAAQVPFVLLSSLLPWLGYRIARAAYESEARALFSAFMCLVAPNYLQVFVVPESVTPFCLASAVCFLSCARARTHRTSSFLGAGVAAALAHLTRADGALVLLAAGVCALRPPSSAKQMSKSLAWLALGYLSVMSPWFARNLRLIDAAMPLSVMRTAWLGAYDELFSYGTDLSWPAWLARTGPAARYQRLVAALRVLMQFFAIFQWLLPALACVGLVRLTRARRALFAGPLVYAALLLLTMCLVFPYPAQYGSLFRGAAGLLPWLMALVPAGLEHVAGSYARWRERKPEQTHTTAEAEQLAQRVFRAGLAITLLLVATLFHLQRLHGLVAGAADHLWNRRLAHYAQVESFLRARGEHGPVLVVDPPGFTLTTGRPSVVVPSDGPAALRAVSDRYRARWLLLEANVPSLADVWRGDAALADFTHVRSFRDELGSPVRLLMRKH